jgi:murein DD-endopeptidase MepM/ murein hydrolase activator NlpD
VVAPENSVISAVLDGTVNFASWTEEYGYVIQIQHENNLLSIYKHCSQLFKKVGDQVTAGSAVAVMAAPAPFPPVSTCILNFGIKASRLIP